MFVGQTFLLGCFILDLHNPIRRYQLEPPRANLALCMLRLTFCSFSAFSSSFFFFSASFFLLSSSFFSFSAALSAALSSLSFLFASFSASFSAFSFALSASAASSSAVLTFSTLTFLGLGVGVSALDWAGPGFDVGVGLGEEVEAVGSAPLVEGADAFLAPARRADCSDGERARKASTASDFICSEPRDASGDAALPRGSV